MINPINAILNIFLKFLKIKSIENQVPLLQVIEIKDRDLNWKIS